MAEYLLKLVMVLLPTAIAFQLVRRELERRGVKMNQFGAVGQVARVLDDMISKPQQSFSGLLKSAKAAISDAKGARPWAATSPTKAEVVEASRFVVGNLDKTEDMGKMRKRMIELMKVRKK
jgi:pyruvate/2-oxoglutarate dehydrogenase complex dihydrolipoamide acyltransferase (E2) component